MRRLAVNRRKEQKKVTLMEEPKIPSGESNITPLRAEAAFYTIAEAARLMGVSSQTIKEWVARGFIKWSRQGDRVVIARADVDEFLPIARALNEIEPLDEEELIESIRDGRRPVVWPKEGQE